MHFARCVGGLNRAGRGFEREPAHVTSVAFILPGRQVVAWDRRVCAIRYSEVIQA